MYISCWLWFKPETVNIFLKINVFCLLSDNCTISLPLLPYHECPSVNHDTWFTIVRSQFLCMEIRSGVATQKIRGSFRVSIQNTVIVSHANVVDTGKLMVATEHVTYRQHPLVPVP